MESIVVGQYIFQNFRRFFPLFLRELYSKERRDWSTEGIIRNGQRTTILQLFLRFSFIQYDYSLNFLIHDTRLIDTNNYKYYTNYT